MTWPWKSHSITSATSIGDRSQVCLESHRENTDLSFQCEDVSHNSNAFGIGRVRVVVLVGSPFEMQSATVCICGE